MNKSVTVRGRQQGFTLVEILIVVIILGILAAIVIPQFTNASTSARESSVVSQLQTLRSQIQLFKLQHDDTLPNLVGTSPACWNQLMIKTDVNGTVDTTAGAYGPYMQSIPANPLNTNANVTAPGAQTATTGWTYDVTAGNILATNQTPTLTFDETTDIVQ
jgi:general secretion pathway protein G